MKRLGLVTACLVSTSCGLLIGSFDECVTHSDCGSKSAGLECVNRLCVSLPPLDDRCQWLGDGSANALVLGSVLPLTRADGTENVTGVARQRALQLAMEQTNPPQRSGIRGRPIGLIACDTTSRPEVLTSLTQQLIRRRVLTIFSSTSGDTIAAARVTVPADTLLMSVSATAAEITDLADGAPDAGSNEPGLVWRTTAPDSLQARVLSRFLADAGTPGVGLVHVNDPYGQGLAVAFSRDYGSTKVQAFPYTLNGDIDVVLDATARTFDAGDTQQALLLVAFPDDAVRLARGAQARPRLRGKRLIFTDSARSPVLLIPETEGAYGTSPAQAGSTSEALQYFTTQYRQRFGIDPLSVSATTNAFDAMMCVMLALHASNGEPGLPLARALTQLRSGTRVPLVPTSFTTLVRELDLRGKVDVDGASGPLDFDERSGEAPAPVELWKIQGQRFEPVDVVVP
jgi:branched-chain amino acid transport system substrate-binding protein